MSATSAAFPQRKRKSISYNFGKRQGPVYGKSFKEDQFNCFEETSATKRTFVVSLSDLMTARCGKCLTPGSSGSSRGATFSIIPNFS